MFELAMNKARSVLVIRNRLLKVSERRGLYLIIASRKNNIRFVSLLLDEESVGYNIKESAHTKRAM